MPDRGTSVWRCSLFIVVLRLITEASDGEVRQVQMIAGNLEVYMRCAMFCTVSCIDPFGCASIQLSVNADLLHGCQSCMVKPRTFLSLVIVMCLDFHIDRH